jgi:hypothetical protein
VVDQVDEPSQRLRVHLDVPPLRAASDGAALPCPRLLERRVDVLAEPADPLRCERPPAGGDPVGVELLPSPVDVRTVDDHAVDVHGTS